MKQMIELGDIFLFFFFSLFSLVNDERENFGRGTIVSSFGRFDKFGRWMIFDENMCLIR